MHDKIALRPFEDRISAAVRARSSSVWQPAGISSRFSVEMMNASL